MTTAERLRKEAAQRILTDQPRAVSLLADAADELDRLSAENERLRLEHEAYRPEVAAEIAVHLAEDADWQAIAEWCGGRVQWETLPSGDVVSWINVGVGRAGEGAWITLGHDGVFRVRWSLDGPERADLVAENERLRRQVDEAEEKLIAETAELRRRIEVLQEVVRQQHACWQTSRMPWQSGSPCEIEFAAALRREATP